MKDCALVCLEHPAGVSLLPPLHHTHLKVSYLRLKVELTHTHIHIHIHTHTHKHTLTHKCIRNELMCLKLIRELKETALQKIMSCLCE